VKGLEDISLEMYKDKQGLRRKQPLLSKMELNCQALKCKSGMLRVGSTISILKYLGCFARCNMTEILRVNK
jgi:hypothetical protein